ANTSNPAEPAGVFRIVGVLPPDFRFIRDYSRGGMDILIPLRVPLRAYLVRLRDSMPPALAEQRITEAVKATGTALPPGWNGVRLDSVQQRYVAGLQPILVTITVAVAFVLVIICTNIGVLMLLRALRRQKEMAVRVALGAGRWHIVRMLLIET